MGVIIHFGLGFSTLKQPAIGDPPIMETPFCTPAWTWTATDPPASTTNLREHKSHRFNESEFAPKYSWTLRFIFLVSKFYCHQIEIIHGICI